MTIETPSVLVRMSPDVVAELEQQGWEFGQPDADGFHTPSLHASEARGIDVDLLGKALISAFRRVAMTRRDDFTGDGWPAYEEHRKPAEVLVVTEIAREVASDYAVHAAAVAPTTVGGNDG